jgi:uncharacterized protein
MQLYASEWEQKLPVVPQIQVTRYCNLACDYCFQEHSGDITELSTVEDILRNVIAHNLRVDSQTKCIQVYWHGGEPLLAGAKFFSKIIQLEKHYSELSFENRIQTNGTLMNDELARICTDNRFQVGFSLDGPRDLHNLHRRFAHSHRGTFDAALKGIDRYRRHAGQGRLAIITVITRASVGRAQEIFKFFKALQADVQLDIFDLRWKDLVQGNGGPASIFELVPSPEEVAQFLIELFDLWFYDQEGLVDFKELRQEVKMALQPEIDRGDPFHKKRCDFRRLIFAPNGWAFSCDQWLNDEQTALGDIRVDSLEKILERKARLWEEIKRRLRVSGEVMGCGQCEWGRQCGGGCLTCMKYNALLHQARARGLPDSRWFEGQLPARWNEIKGETYYCEGLRAFRRHVREAVQRELRDADR